MPINIYKLEGFWWRQSWVPELAHEEPEWLQLKRNSTNYRANSKCFTLHWNRNIYKTLPCLNCSITTNLTICMSIDWENQSKGSSWYCVLPKLNTFKYPFKNQKHNIFCREYTTLIHRNLWRILSLNRIERGILQGLYKTAVMLPSVAFISFFRSLYFATKMDFETYQHMLLENCCLTLLETKSAC